MHRVDAPGAGLIRPDLTHPLRHLDLGSIFLESREEAPDSVRAADVIQATEAKVGLALDDVACRWRVKMSNG